MAKLYPPKLAETTNAGETIIFNAFKPLGHVNPDWIILHSLKQVKLEKGLAIETDFIAMIPGKGIVVIEAKGATGFTLEHGKWTLEGVPAAKKNKDPFEQIDDSVRGIRGFLKKKGYDVNKIPFARLAWFPKIDETNLGSLELGTAIQSSELAFKKHVGEPFKTLSKVVDSHITRSKDNPALNYEPTYFTADMAQHMADALMPKTTVSVSAESKAQERSASRRKATDEQVLLLELVDKNNAVYFEGAAGTGKTAILRQAALDLRRNGRQVLYVCYNIMLVEALQKDIGLIEGITVMDINSVLLKVAGLKSNPKLAGTSWFEEELPDKAIENVKKSSPDFQFDAICIDEFQDIASRPKFFEVLMQLKRSTYMPFKLLMAGDDQQQIAGNGIQVDSFHFAKTEVPNLVHVGLNTNCRQSPKLAASIVKVLGIRNEIKRHRLDADEEGTLEVFSTTQERQLKDLATVINRLLETYRPQDIRVLSVYGSNGSAVAKLFQEGDLHSKELRELRKLLKHPETKAGKISWRSIGKYKGLEDDVVVLTDLSLNTKAWLETQGKTLDTQVYVGLTRARSHAIMLVQDDLFKQFARPLNG